MSKKDWKAVNPKDLRFEDLKTTAKGSKSAKRKKPLRKKPREILEEEIEQTPLPPIPTKPKILPQSEWSRMKSWLKELRRSVSEQVQQAHENQNEKVLVECDLGAQEAEDQLETLLIEFPGSRESILAFQGAARDIRSALVQISRDRTMVKETLLQQKQLLEEQSLSKTDIPTSKVTTTTTVTEAPSTQPIAATPPPVPAVASRDPGTLSQAEVAALIAKEVERTLLAIEKAKEKPPEPKVKVIRQRKLVKPTPASNPPVEETKGGKTPSAETIAGFEKELKLLLAKLPKNPPGIAEEIDALGVRVSKEMGTFPGNQDLDRIYGQIQVMLESLPEAKEEPEVKTPEVAPPPQSAWRNFWRDHWGKVALGLVGLLLLIALGVGSYKFGPKLVSWLKSEPQVATRDYKKIPVPQGLGDTTNNSSALNAAGEAVAPTPITITPTPVIPSGSSVSVNGTTGSSNVITVNQTIINQTANPGNTTAVQPPKGWPEVCTLETVDLDPRLHHKQPLKLSPGESRKFRIPVGVNAKLFSWKHQDSYSVYEGGILNRPTLDEINSSYMSVFNNKLQVELEFWFEFEDRRLPDQR